MTLKFLRSILSWLIGAILIGLLIWDPFFLRPITQKFVEPPAEGGFPFVDIFVAAGVVILAVVLLRELLVEFISAPLRNFFSNIFYPNEAGIPPPNYNLAQLYREQERLDESVEIYLGILKHHPQEPLAYIDGIRTAFDADQPETAEKIAAMTSRITEPEVRNHIAEIYRTAKEEYALRPIEEHTDPTEPVDPSAPASQVEENAGEETTGP